MKIDKRLIAYYIAIIILLALTILWQPRDIYHVYLLGFVSLCALMLNMHYIQRELNMLHDDQVQQLESLNRMADIIKAMKQDQHEFVRIIKLSAEKNGVDIYKHDKKN